MGSGKKATLVLPDIWLNMFKKGTLNRNGLIFWTIIGKSGMRISTISVFLLQKKMLKKRWGQQQNSCGE